jgi:thiamine-monophosphate kinase
MLPPTLPVADVDGVLDGLLEMAASAGVALAGGNLTRSPGPLIVDVTVTGSVKPRKILTRAGARGPRPLRQRHDWGGGGRARVAPAATAKGWSIPEDAGLAACVARHRRPEPRASWRAARRSARPPPAWT